MFGRLRPFPTPTVPLTLAVVLVAGMFATAQAQTAPPAKAKAKAAPKASPAAKVDLNKASAEELAESLPGIGPVTAKKIVDGRPYEKLDDLARVGVPTRTIETLRPLATLSTPAPTAPTATTATTKPAASGPINLNTASVDQLQELPGVGPVAAAAIVAARPFKSVDDLERVRGLGAAKIEALRARATVAATPPTTTATKPMTKSAAAKPARIAPGQIVNINTAPKEVLDLLPGIGPVKAQAIIEGRPFKTKEDVMKVKGIKEVEFSKIKDMITVN